MVWGLSPELAILFGTASAGLLGFIVGGLAIRRQGIYFAMVTLALAQMVYFVALQMPFTGGENGLQAIPRGRLFGVIDLDDTMTMYVFVVVVFLIGEIGRASCRERVCQYVSISVVAVSLKKKYK